MFFIPALVERPTLPPIFIAYASTPQSTVGTVLCFHQLLGLYSHFRVFGSVPCADMARRAAAVYCTDFLSSAIVFMNIAGCTFIFLQVVPRTPVSADIRNRLTEPLPAGAGRSAVSRFSWGEWQTHGV
jgi:hypothetical protein